MLLTDASPTEYWGSEAVKVSSALKKGRSVFITGPAGTGKSALTREIKKNLGDSAVLTSTTGISAMNIGGSTIHSFSGIGIHSDPRAVEAVVNTMHWPHVRKKIRETQVVMIDEISMLRKDTLNLIERVFQKAMGNIDSFGGKSMLFCGDFLQLPPVPKHDDIDSNNWSFNSSSWLDAEPYTIQLGKVHRQTDIPFLTALSEVRIGSCTETTESLFQARDVNLSGVKVENNLRFFPTNREADGYNQKRLDDLTGDVHHHQASVWGLTDGLAAQIRDTCLGVENLQLKVGAKVIVLINDSKTERFANGSLATVIGYEDPNTPVVRIERNKAEVPLPPFQWELLDYRGKVLAEFVQVPLKLAYGITIHKSQGLTLDEAVIDCRRIFAPGQAYVALSRVRESSGLYLSNWSPRHVMADPLALRFYEQISKRRTKP